MKWDFAYTYIITYIYIYFDKDVYIFFEREGTSDIPNPKPVIFSMEIII